MRLNLPERVKCIFIGYYSTNRAGGGKKMIEFIHVTVILFRETIPLFVSDSRLNGKTCDYSLCLRGCVRIVSFFNSHLSVSTVHGESDKNVF